MKLINGERLLYADKVKKTNMFEWTQERTLVITNVALYNIHKKEVKRTIFIKDIGGITKTVPPSKAKEFTVHVPSTYDYRFITERREEIIDLIKRLYLIEHKKNVLMFHVTDKNLKDFTTTESDMKKKASKFPTNNYLAKDEDLMILETPVLSKMSTTESDDGIGNLDEKQDIRRMQLNDSDTGSEYSDARPEEEEDNEMR